MTSGRQRTAARWLAAIAALLVLAGTAVLWVDYARERRRTAADTARIEALQAQAAADAAYAAAVAAAQDEISRTRRARKARGAALADAVIGAAVLFIAAAKWLVVLRGQRGTTMIPLAALRGGLRSPTGRAPLPAAGAAPGIDLSAVDRIVASEGRGRESAIPILQAIQAHFRYLPDEALARVCETTEVTPAQIAGTSSFYAHFRRSPVGEHVVRVCHGTACHVAGARQITDELRRRLHIPDGADTDPSRTFTLDEVACLGCCSLAPVLMVDSRTTGRLTPAAACDALEQAHAAEPV